MQRTPSWSTDPDTCALQALTQALDVGKKILRDRMDKIPDVKSDNTPAGKESWRLSLQNHAQWNPKVSQWLLFSRSRWLFQIFVLTLSHTLDYRANRYLTCPGGLLVLPLISFMYRARSTTGSGFAAAHKQPKNIWEKSPA
jgi:hypothetical protein